jgi:hypothetical protein
MFHYGSEIDDEQARHTAVWQEKSEGTAGDHHTGH